MFAYIVKRFIVTVPTLIGMSVLIFAVLQVIPGTIIDQMIGTEGIVTPEMQEDLERRFGLDLPVPLQYARWLGNALTGDLGISWRVGEPVVDVVLARLGLTIELSLLALALALIIGIPGGILAALKKNAWIEHVLRVVSLFSLSMPIFWQAAMMLLVLSVGFSWAPPAGYRGPFEDLARNLQTLLLPALVLGTATSAVILRMTRASILDIITLNYITTARSKGLAGRVVLYKHCLRNALIPIITVAGLQLGYLLGGAVVTEQVFALPGLGRLTLLAIYERDYPLVQGAILVISALFVATNFLVDVLYVVIDPRIKYDVG